jgi:peptide/nickel transport system permease protein
MLIPVMLGVTVIIFTLMYLIPGDPAVAILGSQAEPWEYEALREKMGLNDSYIEQLFRYIYQVYIQFDLGSSYLTGVSVTTELMGRIPRTLFLGFSGILLTIIVGIPLGVNAAVRQNTVADWLPLSIALIGVSMPGFWLSLMLVLVFSVQLGWLPAFGMATPAHWILPIVSGSFTGIASMARQTRSSMLEVINSDYITMARAKGVPEKTVIYRHAFPNALTPVITIMGTTCAALLGGGLLTETIFSIPGVGFYMVRSINNRDYPAVQSSVLIIAIVFALVILVTDLVLAMVDPRIKAQFSGGGKKKKKKTEAVK